MANFRLSKKWTCGPALAGGGKLAVIAVAGGVLSIIDEETKNKEALAYAAIGGGLGFGIDLPSSATVVNLVVNNAADAISQGNLGPSRIFFNENKIKGDLKRDDFGGIALLANCSVGAVAGISGTVMLFGIDKMALAKAIAAGATAMSPLGMVVENCAALAAAAISAGHVEAAATGVAAVADKLLLSRYAFNTLVNGTSGIIALGGVGLQDTYGAGIFGYLCGTTMLSAPFSGPPITTYGVTEKGEIIMGGP